MRGFAPAARCQALCHAAKVGRSRRCARARRAGRERNGQRLLASYFSRGGSLSAALGALRSALCAVEVHEETFRQTRARVVAGLQAAGIARADSHQLADAWLVRDDFLLTPLGGQFDFVVGNPPYVRQERISGALLGEYRKRFATLYDRADLYIPFYERGLDVLAPCGALGYICANRWLKNKFGGPLREKICSTFHVQYYIDLERSDAFGSEVLAYPGITIIRRKEAAPTRIALAADKGEFDVRAAVATLEAPTFAPDNVHYFEVSATTRGRDPWLLDSPRVIPIIGCGSHID